MLSILTFDACSSSHRLVAAQTAVLCPCACDLSRSANHGAVCLQSGSCAVLLRGGGVSRLLLMMMHRRAITFGSITSFPGDEFKEWLRLIVYYERRSKLAFLDF